MTTDFWSWRNAPSLLKRSPDRDRHRLREVHPLRPLRFRVAAGLLVVAESYRAASCEGKTVMTHPEKDLSHGVLFLRKDRGIN